MKFFQKIVAVFMVTLLVLPIFSEGVLALSAKEKFLNQFVSDPNLADKVKGGRILKFKPINQLESEGLIEPLKVIEEEEKNLDDDLLKKEEATEYKVGDILFGQEVVEMVDSVPYKANGTPFFNYAGGMTNSYKDKNSRRDLKILLSSQEDMKSTDYVTLKVRFTDYKYEKDILEYEEKYNLKTLGFEYWWNSSGYTWFSPDKDYEGSDYSKSFEEFREWQIQILKRDLKQWGIELDSSVWENYRNESGTKSLHKSMERMVRASLKELEYFENKKNGLLCIGIKLKIAPENLEKFLAETGGEVYIEEVSIAKKKTSQIGYTGSSINYFSSSSSSLEKHSQVQTTKNIELQEAGSNISPFLTWAPSMSRIDYDFTDPKNSLLSSTFFWTDHLGFNSIHTGYEHEIRINSFNFVDCKDRENQDWYGDKIFDLDECLDESVALRSSSSDNIPDAYIDTRYRDGDKEDKTLTFSIGFMDINQKRNNNGVLRDREIKDYEWYRVEYKVEKVGEEKSINIELVNELTHYANNNEIQTGGFLKRKFKEASGIKTQYDFCKFLQYGAMGGKRMNEGAACMFKSDSLIVKREEGIKMGTEGFFNATGLVGLALKNKEVNVNEITKKIRDVYYDKKHYETKGTLAGLLNKIGTPYSHNGGGVYLHEWDGVWLQNFKQENDKFGKYGNGESAIMYSDLLEKAFLVKENFWETYARYGAKVVGYPTGEVKNGKQCFSKGCIKGDKFYPHTATSKHFSDIGDHWAKLHIDFVSKRNIVKGDAGKTTFRPDDGVNKIEALKMAYVAANIAPLPECSNDHWGCEYMKYAEKEGIIDLLNFQPDEKVTRGETAYFISRFFKVQEKNGIYLYNGKKEIPLVQEKTTFTDLSASTKYSKDIYWLANVLVPDNKYIKSISLNPIIKGYSKDGAPTGKFGPENGVTRAELSKIITGAYLFKEEHFPLEQMSLQGVDGNTEKLFVITTAIGSLYEQHFDAKNEYAPKAFPSAEDKISLVERGVQYIIPGDFSGDNNIKIPSFSHIKISASKADADGDEQFYFWNATGGSLVGWEQKNFSEIEWIPPNLDFLLWDQKQNSSSPVLPSNCSQTLDKKGFSCVYTINVTRGDGRGYIGQGSINLAVTYGSATEDLLYNNYYIKGLGIFSDDFRKEILSLEQELIDQLDIDEETGVILLKTEDGSIRFTEEKYREMMDEFFLMIEEAKRKILGSNHYNLGDTALLTKKTPTIRSTKEGGKWTSYDTWEIWAEVPQLETITDSSGNEKTQLSSSKNWEWLSLKEISDPGHYLYPYKRNFLRIPNRSDTVEVNGLVEINTNRQISIENLYVQPAGEIFLGKNISSLYLNIFQDLINDGVISDTRSSGRMTIKLYQSFQNTGNINIEYVNLYGSKPRKWINKNIDENGIKRVHPYSSFEFLNSPTINNWYGNNSYEINLPENGYLKTQYKICSGKYKNGTVFCLSSDNVDFQKISNLSADKIVFDKGLKKFASNYGGVILKGEVLVTKNTHLQNEGNRTVFVNIQGAITNNGVIQRSPDGGNIYFRHYGNIENNGVLKPYYAYLYTPLKNKNNEVPSLKISGSVPIEPQILSFQGSFDLEPEQEIKAKSISASSRNKIKITNDQPLVFSGEVCSFGGVLYGTLVCKSENNQSQKIFSITADQVVLDGGIKNITLNYGGLRWSGNFLITKNTRLQNEGNKAVSIDLKGDIINNGEVSKNKKGGRLDLKSHGDVENNRVFDPYYLYLYKNLDNTPKKISGSVPIEPQILSFQGSFDLEPEQEIKAKSISASSRNKIKITNDQPFILSGERCGFGGKLLGDLICQSAEDEVQKLSRITADNLLLTGGIKEVSYGRFVIDAYTTISEDTVLQNKEGDSTWITFNKGIVNNGVIKNNDGGGYISLKTYSDIDNKGLWGGNYLYIYGPETKKLFGTATIKPRYINFYSHQKFDFSPVFGAITNFNRNKITIPSNGKIVLKGSTCYSNAVLVGGKTIECAGTDNGLPQKLSSVKNASRVVLSGGEKHMNSYRFDYLTDLEIKPGVKITSPYRHQLLVVYGDIINNGQIGSVSSPNISVFSTSLQGSGMVNARSIGFIPVKKYEGVSYYEYQISDSSGEFSDRKDRYGRVLPPAYTSYRSSINLPDVKNRSEWRVRIRKKGSSNWQTKKFER